VEERCPAKENTASKTRPGRRAGSGAPSALDRVCEVAGRDKEARFRALLHHVDLDRLRAAYWAIRPQAAPGVDGVRWEAYGQDLQARLQDLHARLHSGRYRARPSRRSYIVRREALCCIPNTVGRNLEDRFWVQWLTLIRKVYGNRSMPGNQRPLNASRVGRWETRVISVKAGLLEAQSSDGEHPHPPERRVKPVPHPALAWNVGRGNLQGAGDVQRGH